MAVLNFFNSFLEALPEKVHNLGSDTLKVALTNTEPVATNTQLSNITEIAYTYCSGRTLTVSSSTYSGGYYRLKINDLTLSATGGTVGPFRYVVIYNDTATNDELIGWGDYGQSASIQDGGSFEIEFDQTAGVVILTRAT